MRSHTVALLALCLAALQLAVLAAPLQHFSGLLGRSLGSRPSLGHSRHLHLARRSASPVAQWPRSQLISAQFQPEPSEYKNKRFVTRSDIKSSSDNKKRSDNNFVKPATSSSGPKVNPKHHSNFSKRDSNCTKRSDSDFSLKGDAMAASYYPDWNGNNFPPEKVDYSLFDLIYFGMFLFFYTQS